MAGEAEESGIGGFMDSKDVVARCDKCYLGYVWMNPKKTQIKCLRYDCNGTVRRLQGNYAKTDFQNLSTDENSKTADEAQ